MSNAWFTSDTHLGHDYVARLRGFSDATEHDAALAEAWNAQVSKRDVVWHLGDVGIGPLSRFSPTLAVLQGEAHLVPGNHCQVHPMHRGAHLKQRAWLEFFSSIAPFSRRRVPGLHHQDVLLSHLPYAGEGQRDQPDRHTQYRLRNEGLPLIHGHTHDGDQRLSFSDGAPMVHVGWDAWGRLVHLDEVAALLREGMEQAR